MKLLKKNALWLLPIFFMLLITPFTPQIDMAVARFTYHHNIADNPSTVHHGFSSNIFFDFIYKYGVTPAQITCGVATLCFLLSYCLPKLRRFRSIALLFSLTLIIGAGLITHQLFKEFWGRPRPRQLIEFGGKQTFLPYYIPRIDQNHEPAKSFPSGHSTCGFYFFTLYFVGRRHKKIELARLGLFIGSALGILLSTARVVQGGHFVSDVVFAGLLMWETAYFVDWLVYEKSFLALRESLPD